METAVLELGTRTFQLSRATQTDNGAASINSLAVECVAFGADIDAHGSLGRRAWADALSALDRLLRAAQRNRLKTLLAVAPHALGGAEDAEGFVRAVERRFGVRVDLLSPTETAQLAYRGARRALMPIDALGVVHLGDSTIDVAAGRGAQCDITDSLPLGITRIHRAYDATDAGLEASDCQALLGLMRLSGGPAARRLREYGAPVVMASGYAGAVLDVARAWGYVDALSPSIGRLALHALVPELVLSGPEALTQLGVEPWRASLLGTAAVAIDALAGLLGQREVWLMSDGVTEGLALEALAMLESTAATGMGFDARGPRGVRQAATTSGYVPVTVA